MQKLVKCSTSYEAHQTFGRPLHQQEHTQKTTVAHGRMLAKLEEEQEQEQTSRQHAVGEQQSDGGSSSTGGAAGAGAYDEDGRARQEQMLVAVVGKQHAYGCRTWLEKTATTRREE
jgi:hypothetical protein